MEESPFSVVSERTVPVTRTWTADSILGYLYSTSFARADLFGDRLKDFDSEVRAVLGEINSENTFVEENEFLIRIGQRPASPR